MSGILKQPKDPPGSPVTNPQDLNPDSQNPIDKDLLISDKTKPEDILEETKPKDTLEDLYKKLPAEEKEPQATIPEDDSNLQPSNSTSKTTLKILWIQNLKRKVSWDHQPDERI